MGFTPKPARLGVQMKCPDTFQGSKISGYIRSPMRIYPCQIMSQEHECISFQDLLSVLCVSVAKTGYISGSHTSLGIVIVKVVPFPSSLSTVISP